MNAVELRENLRALAATILHIVQYESTEYEVRAALKENRRLADELEKTLDFDRLCAETDRKIYKSLMAETTGAEGFQYKPITLTEEEKRLVEARSYRPEQIAKFFRVDESYLSRYVPSPAREAVADIVKDHLLPPAPFIDRGKAE